ncbi:MAG: N-acetylglucosaminyldiphosphodolichol N-acetylglucosaminyltransferase catalytic subunit alg13 [Caeruleum heppii]|nr:MAG: N-acetylglucosaminyldiphosphodolichol N-acetylglucosaminyltransferase catalytic subunit alg13 [Caeruleum heppii]KAI9673691.1 MAG: N-acetylglucosaminyldiphosphodolichol N-acetylglucosaminyltransferase catalytic subunit alg13 [Caeruleum heppii]
MVESSPPKKLCFVTIGATADFNALITGVLSQPFLQALKRAHYTHLLIQYGKGGASLFSDYIQQRRADGERTGDINVEGFDFDKAGLTKQMSAARGQKGDSEGVVVSHAGSGSILDALRIGVPLIVVPNPELLDNHQVELAEELAAQGYVIHGKLEDLPAAVEDAEKLRERHKSWPPVNSGADPSGRGLAGVMDDEMGFLD